MSKVTFNLNESNDAFVFSNDLIIPFGELSPNFTDWLNSWRKLYMKEWCDDLMIMKIASIVGKYYNDDMYDVIFEVGRLSICKDLSKGYFDPTLGLYIENYKQNHQNK
jgi:hypothetical protein